MSIGIITCVYGDFDALFPLPPDHGFDEAVCVTDNPRLCVEGWTTVLFPPVYPSMGIAAKFPRCFPELFLNTDSSVWIDASFRIKSYDELTAFLDPQHIILRKPSEEHQQRQEVPLYEGQNYTEPLSFKEWALQHLEKGEIVLLKHPEGRDCAYQEANHGKRLMWKPKYREYPLDEQVVAYKEDGMPSNNGLWAVGYMARHHSATAYELSLKWWKEILKWGPLCQVSLPYVLWKHKWSLSAPFYKKIVEWEQFNGGNVFGIASDGITPLIKYHPYLENYQHLTELEEIIQISQEPTLSVIVVDNFYKDPDKVREVALESEFIEDLRYYKGRRSFKNYRPLSIKRKIEDLLGKRITDWEGQGHNGKFQYCIAEDPVVYHWDNQKYAAIVFLNPDAPYEAGTSLFASKSTNRTHRDDTTLEDPFGGGFYDKTKFKLVDQIGNVYNRMIIFDAGCVHAASEYFGTDVTNSRLFQIFFFNTE
jgi:hypothetical protein